MKTIVFHIEYQNEEDKHFVKNEDRMISSAVRYAFNRFREGKLQSPIYHDISEKYPLNSYLISCLVREAYVLNERVKKMEKDSGKPVKFHFGSFKQRSKGLISKEDYRESRMRGIFSEGEKSHYGNRLFKIDVETQTIVYKQAFKHHIPLKISEKLSKKRKNLLNLIHRSMLECSTPVTFRIAHDKVYITYDEIIVEKHRKFNGLFENRIMGLDLNPNYFGLSILEFDKNDNYKILRKEVFDLSKLQKDGPNNKVNYELQQIECKILKICKHFRVKKLCVEDLSMRPKNHKKGKSFNKMVNNKWKFKKTIDHLKVLCSTFGVDLIEVNPAYSSIVGNFLYGGADCPDMVASSMEIARRGFHQYQKGWFYPAFDKQRIKISLKNLRKNDSKKKYPDSWKGLSEEIKESKIRYRFQLSDCDAVFRRNYLKMMISVECF